VRLRSEIWVKAYLRVCQQKLITAMVVRRGDNDAGAIYIKVNRLDGNASLYGPAPSGFTSSENTQLWMAHLDGPHVNEEDVDQFLLQQMKFDSDLWIIELEDKEGRHLLEDWLRRSDVN